MLEFLSRFEFLNRFFKREETKKAASERLRLVLVHDRASVTPDMMNSLKEEIISVIRRYMEIDTAAMEIGLERRAGSIALAANIPVLRVLRRMPNMPAKEKSEEGSCAKAVSKDEEKANIKEQAPEPAPQIWSKAKFRKFHRRGRKKDFASSRRKPNLGQRRSTPPKGQADSEGPKI